MDKNRNLKEEVTAIVNGFRIYRCSKSNLSVMKDDIGDNALRLSGGLNGNGEWKDYFIDLSSIFRVFEEHKINATVIKIENDILDDIFYLDIAFAEIKD